MHILTIVTKMIARTTVFTRVWDFRVSPFGTMSELLDLKSYSWQTKQLGVGQHMRL